MFDPSMKPCRPKLGRFLLIALAGCSPGAEHQQQDQSAGNMIGVAAMQTVTSRDGTKIAYDRLGSGPPVVLVNGALSERSASSGLASLLAQDFTVYSYDRRGRGDSRDGGDKSPALQREIEDIEALIEEAGGTVHLVGFSSGAALALEAASALGPKISKLAVYEAPYDESAGADDRWKRYRKEQAELLAAGRRADAVLHHMKYVGIPGPVVAKMKASPPWARMEAMAPTLAYDVAAIGEDRSVPVERLRTIRAEALVMDGGANLETMPFMAASADRIAGAIANARRRTIAGQGHNASPEVLAPVLIEFFAAE